MALIMQCARAHALTAPYLYFERIGVVGVLSEEMKAAMSKATNWQASNDDGTPKPDGYYLCLPCFLELVRAMEEWRVGGTSCPQP